MLQLAHATICCISCSSNCFLLYLIIFHTPLQLKPYSVMLITLSSYELTTSSSSFIIFPRIVPLGSEGIVCVYEGPCAYLENDFICFLIYILVLHGFTMYNLQMTANFCFRFYVLWRQNPGVKRVITANMTLLIPTILCVACFLRCLAPDEQVRKLVLTNAPQYDLSHTRLIGLVDVRHSWALPSISLIVGTALPCTIINVLVGNAASRFLRDHATRFSSRIRASHQEFLKVLTFQNFVSQSFLIAVACYVFGQLDIVRSPFQEYATHMIGHRAMRPTERCLTTIGDCCIVSSPLLTMFFVRPYRRQIERMFSLRTDRVLRRSQWTENGDDAVSETSSTKMAAAGPNVRQ